LTTKLTRHGFEFSASKGGYALVYHVSELVGVSETLHVARFRGKFHAKRDGHGVYESLIARRGENVPSDIAFVSKRNFCRSFEKHHLGSVVIF
jgi:hypothetical protein